MEFTRNSMDIFGIINTNVLDSKQSLSLDSKALKILKNKYSLMENAGRAVSGFIVDNYQPCFVLVLCGTGNNGGDGFVVARRLLAEGFEVEVGYENKNKNLSPDIKKMKDLCSLSTVSFESASKCNPDLIVDALMGTGLNRDLDIKTQKLIEITNRKQVPIISIDIPTGIDSSSGAIRGAAIKASKTITFEFLKLGHLIYPGRKYCGDIIVSSIKIPEECHKNNISKIFVNVPKLWKEKIPTHEAEVHKYNKGHTLIMGGKKHKSGAAKLAAVAALRAGSGLVTIAINEDAIESYASNLLSIMLEVYDAKDQINKLIKKKKINSVVIGPGFGISNHTIDLLEELVNQNLNVVIDADAISVFQNELNRFKNLLCKSKNLVITPHDGELRRIFPTLKGNRLERALKAAKFFNSVVVLKGPDTVIANYNGEAVVNYNGSTDLATAGSGDVLSGIIAGLLAQGMPLFESSSAAVWMHSKAALFKGTGLIAEDLPDLIPNVLKELSIEEK